MATTRKARVPMAEQIPAPNYGHLEESRPRQDVVPIDIVPEQLPEQHTASRMQQMYLDNSHTIEVIMKDVRIHVSNDVDPVLLTMTFRLIREFSQPAVQGVQYCNRLFSIEDSINKKYPGDYEKRKQLRLEKEKHVLEAFWSWLDQQKPVRSQLAGRTGCSVIQCSGIHNG